MDRMMMMIVDVGKKNCVQLKCLYNIVRCDDFEFENKTIVCKTLALNFVMLALCNVAVKFARCINAIKKNKTSSFGLLVVGHWCFIVFLWIAYVVCQCTVACFFFYMTSVKNKALIWRVLTWISQFIVFSYWPILSETFSFYKYFY